MSIPANASICFAPRPEHLRKYQKQKVNNTLPSLNMRALLESASSKRGNTCCLPRRKRETSRVRKAATPRRQREGDAKERGDVKRENSTREGKRIAGS